MTKRMKKKIYDHHLSIKIRSNESMLIDFFCSKVLDKRGNQRFKGRSHFIREALKVYLDRMVDEYGYPEGFWNPLQKDKFIPKETKTYTDEEALDKFRQLIE